MMKQKSAVTALPLTMVVTAGLIMIPLMVGAGERKEGPAKQGADMFGLTADTSRLGSPDEGGIAGVSISQNFESGFTPGSGCGQNGWTGFCAPGVGFLIVENIPADPVFGSFSALHQSDGSGIAGVEIRSPELPAAETGRIDADILISDTASAYLLQSSPCTVAGCLINTRLNFNPNGNIEVLQLTPGNCTTGVFADSGADWAAGVTFRIGPEVDGLGVLRVYKDNVLIFTGTDIAFSCAPAGPQGISNIGVFAVNAVGAATTLRLDNISSGGGTAPCPANIATTGSSATVVDIDDLLAVISAWGPCPAPPASCPANIATAGASASNVDIDDLLAVISAWGPCP